MTVHNFDTRIYNCLRNNLDYPLSRFCTQLEIHRTRRLDGMRTTTFVGVPLPNGEIVDALWSGCEIITRRRLSGYQGSQNYDTFVKSSVKIIHSQNYGHLEKLLQNSELYKRSPTEDNAPSELL